VPETPHREVWLAQTEAAAGTGGLFFLATRTQRLLKFSDIDSGCRGADDA